MRKIWLIFLLLFSYQFFFGTFIFLFNIEQENIVEYQLSDLEESKDNAKALLLDDNEEALAVRLSMIKHSQSSIKIAVHRFKDDATSNLITAALIEKLDQGVSVEIIIDGVMNTNLQQENYLLLINHGATMKAYEPNVLLLPYKSQNRLHDKFFIFDDTTAIIGGRNIGDRYFTNGENVVYDRDVLLMDKTVVGDMINYFHELFDIDYAKTIQQKPVDLQKREAINQKYLDYQELHHLNSIYQEIDERMITVDGLMFIHNPINRFKKEPVIMDTLFELLLREQKGIIQSPYIVFNHYLEHKFLELQNVDLTLITNTVKTSPNLFASSGYIVERNAIAKEHTLYEIQSNIARHSKTWLIGEEYIAIGSLNMDPRSASLSTESMVIIKSEEIYLLIDEVISAELTISLQVGDDGEYINNETILTIEDRPIKTLLIKAIGIVTYFFHDLL